VHSKDIVQRWTFPVVPDNNWSGSTFYTFQRGNIYKEHPAGEDAVHIRVLAFDVELICG